MGPCLTNIDRKDPSGGKPCTAESSMFPVIVVIRRQNEFRMVSSILLQVKDSFETIMILLVYQLQYRFLNSL